MDQKVIEQTCQKRLNPLPTRYIKDYLCFEILNYPLGNCEYAFGTL